MIIKLDKLVYGGQALGTHDDGRKVFVWGGLPEETVEVRITKKRSKYYEAVVERLVKPSTDRIEPIDPGSFLSTSPWQIVNFEAEQRFKSELIAQAFEQHHIKLASKNKVYTDETQYNYRNKVEFSWYSDLDAISGVDTLDIAFFKRGGRGKIVIEGTSLAREEINNLAIAIRDLLRTKNISARQLKTLLIRSNQNGVCVWQLYTKDKIPDIISPKEAESLPVNGGGGEVIYSDPRSPASVITEKLASFGNTTLRDDILGTSFNYPAESFFQINIPVYERALLDMKKWVEEIDLPTVDMYSGVGTIGLTIGGAKTTLVEVNESAVNEMKSNIERLSSQAQAILAPSENALEFITKDKLIIVDPPRAGLHQNVVDRLLEELPPRIVYLSCNPSTQARDVALLLESYKIVHHQGYNFFPLTPHIENLIVLDKL